LHCEVNQEKLKDSLKNFISLQKDDNSYDK